jgi:hypothetical protein
VSKDSIFDFFIFSRLSSCVMSIPQSFDTVMHSSNLNVSLKEKVWVDV